MPRNQLGSVPFPPLEVLQRDSPIDGALINQLASKREIRNGISILIRSETGHPKRGGYFFHFRKIDNSTDEYELFDFQKTQVASLSERELILLINHCSGARYNEESYLVCQNEINLRSDD